MQDLTVRPIALAQTRRLRQEVLRPYQTVEELAGHEPSGAVAFGAFDDGELIAVGLVGADGAPGDWRIRGMATKPDARGRGAGTQILQALVRHALAHGAARVWCNARTPARSLYERAGFEVVSEEFEEPKIGPHYRMELRVGPLTARANPACSPPPANSPNTSELSSARSRTSRGIPGAQQSRHRPTH